MNSFFSSAPLPAISRTGILTLVRVTVGGFMIYHGCEVLDAKTMNGYLQWDMFKGSTAAKCMVYAGKSCELLGGTLLFLGLLTRLAALLILGVMLYVSLFVGHGIIWYDDQPPFLFVLLALVFLAFGPGKISLDHLFFKKKT